MKIRIIKVTTHARGEYFSVLADVEGLGRIRAVKVFGVREWVFADRRSLSKKEREAFDTKMSNLFNRARKDQRRRLKGMFAA
jgi:hypothetical protein